MVSVVFNEMPESADPSVVEETSGAGKALASKQRWLELFRVELSSCDESPICWPLVI